MGLYIGVRLIAISWKGLFRLQPGATRCNLLHRNRRDEHINLLCGLYLHAQKQVATHIQGDGWLGMAQHPGYNNDWNAVVEHQGRSCMPQIVKPDDGQTSPPSQQFEISQDIAGVVWGSIPGGEDQAILILQFSSFLLGAVLALIMIPKRLDRSRYQHNRSLAISGLGLRELDFF